MTALVVLLPVLLAIAGPTRTYLREAVPAQWKYLLGMSEQPKQSTERAAHAAASSAAIVVADCCSSAPVQLALANFSKGEKLFSVQQGEARKALGSMRSSGAVFVNDAPVTEETTIFENDLLRTGSDGLARIDVKNHGAISVYQNTRISFTANWRHFASLLEGKITVLSFPAASRFQVNIGYFVLTPSAETSSSAEVEMAADGSAVVRATEGTIGVIALEGPTALFLQPGEAARVTATGETFPVKAGEPPPATATAPGKQPETKAQPASTPQPKSTPQPSVEKKGTNPIVWVALVGGGVAGAAMALGKKSSSTSTPVSPSTP